MSLVSERDGLYRSYFVILTLADVDERDVVERLLRSFDFTASFGPVAGLSRLQRWERAQRLGKNPPAIIREILQTEEGTTEARYRESYLYGHF